MALVSNRAGDLLAAAGRGPGDVRGIGLSLPGSVDVEAAASREEPILRGWDGVPLATYSAGFADAPVLLENDANATALSERDSVLRSTRDVLVVKASTGLGAGLLVDGRLVRGAWGAAGELGHVRSAAAAGVPCRCGESGCLEAVASGWAIVQAMRESGRRQPPQPAGRAHRRRPGRDVRPAGRRRPGDPLCRCLRMPMPPRW